MGYDFNHKVTRGDYREQPYRVDKLCEDGEWRKMSSWRSSPDEELLQRHVRVLGGQVRLLKGDQVVREWRDGDEVAP